MLERGGRPFKSNYIIIIISLQSVRGGGGGELGYRVVSYEYSLLFIWKFFSKVNLLKAKRVFFANYPFGHLQMDQNVYCAGSGT